MIYVEPRHRAILAFSMFLPMFVNYFATGALSTVMPAVIGSIGGMQYYGLVFTIATVALAIMSPVSSKISQRFGHRQMFLWGTLVMLVTTAAAGVVPNMELMLVARLISGVAAAFTIVGGLTITGLIFPAEQRVRFLGYYAAITSAGNVLAPLLGGIFADGIGWQWAFFAPVPIGVLGLVGFIRFMPKTPRERQRGKFDLIGTVVFAGLMILITALCQWGGTRFAWASPAALLGLAVVVILAVVYVLVERRQGESALMPMTLMNKPVFVLCLFSVIVAIAATISLYVYLPLFLQNVMGRSAVEAGLSVTVFSIVQTLGSPVLGQFISKTGRIRAAMFTGLVIVGGANLFYFLLASPALSMALVFGVQIIYGVGACIMNAIFVMAVQMLLPPEDIGVATANIQMGQTMGASIGMAAFGAIMNVSADLSFSIPLVFAVSAGLCAVAIVLTIFLRPAKQAVS